MIVTENYMTRADGTVLVRTYSDAGKCIKRDGVLYQEAIDPVGSGRVYEETEEDLVISEQEALEELLEVLA